MNQDILTAFLEREHLPEYGTKLYSLCAQLFPITRSIAGPGLRSSLKLIQAIIPRLKINSVRSGKKIYSWTVPDEWLLNYAKLVDVTDNKVLADTDVSNLHVVNYSQPFHKVLNYESLVPHLYYLRDLPNAIPYVTKYYSRDWGICLEYSKFRALDPSHKYLVDIDTSFDPSGCLNYGDLVVKGFSSQEILFSSYLCHPSMANNELSGPSILAYLAQYISSFRNLRYTYRFVLAPETIGAVCYIERNFKRLKKNVLAAFNVNCVGDSGDFSYLQSKYENSFADKLALSALRTSTCAFNTYPHSSRGSDERQYSGPGLGLPMVSIMRSKYGTYDEYHTSADDLNFISAQSLGESFRVYQMLFYLLELNCKPISRFPCETFLSQYDLYPSVGNNASYAYSKGSLRYRDFLHYADGTNDLIDISILIDLDMDAIVEIYSILLENNLITESL